MLLMQSTSGRRSHGWDGRFWPPEHDFKPDGRILNWASVASWFMRPEGRPIHPDNVLPPTVCTSIRCTVPGCSCECFTPGKLHIRYCETCSHGWVPHALDKLGFRNVLGQTSVEPVQVNVAFDIASLVLYGCQALPIRLKILLDRLFSVLQRDEVVQVLRGFGWTQEDYARGYILQEPHGAVLDRWNICSPEEEPLVLQQFLRFGETRAITQQLLLHGVGDGRYLPRMEADIKKFLERAPGRPLLKDERKAHLPRPAQQHSPLQHKPHPPPFKLPPTGLTCIPAPPPTSSPPGSMGNNTLTVSPLNRLQNMQPFDFRKIGKSASPDERKKPEEPAPAGLMNLCVSSASPICLPPPPLMQSQPQFGHKSPSAEYYHNSSEFGSEEDEDDDENSQSALNLSRDASNLMRARPCHNRKNTTPVKRQWGSTPLPLNLGTQLINPATGKKRVQCNVCLKTFCDKGALKIHFSAVHLREMHKCTVEGCNMMFSSRRSRNRHSANPNPKLHSPHLRRKISPHDGRSAQNHPLLMPPLPAGLNPLTFGTFPLLTPPPELRHQATALDLKQSLDLSCVKHEDMRKSDNSEHMDDYMLDDDDEDGIVVEGTGDSDGDSDNHHSEKQGSSPAKRFKVSESDGDMDEDVISNMDSNEDSLSVVDCHSVKEENGPENLVTKSSRKRKNRNPTRCAVLQTINHGENIISDDDSSNNIVYKSHDLRIDKSSFSEEKSEDLSMKRNEEEHENNNTIKKNDDNPQESSICNHYDNKEGLNLTMSDSKNDEPENYALKKNEVSEEELRDEKPRPSSRNGESHRSEESMDSSNALRQLENLSQGHFGDLGRQQDYSMKYSDQDPPSPARSHGSSISSNDDMGSDDPDMQGYFNDGMDVPIDKDNPRMCTACGKVFQNHFGVKTHYQNVHLKLMHKCTVDGCNAAFPSKRSRDRHSANLNLHRKLLSTSLSDKSNMFLDPSHLSSIAANPALHTEFLARLYADSGSLPHLPPPGLLNGDRLHPLPFLHPLGFPPFIAPHLNGRSSGSVSPSSVPDSPHPIYADDDVDRTPDRDGILPCRFCNQSLKDAGSLREHYETQHLQDMHRCTVPGCGLVFASSKRRNAHAEDEQVHKKT